MGRYVYMEAIYPNANAYKFYELTQKGKNVTQRYGRIADGYEGGGRVSPGGRTQHLKSAKHGNSPYSSEGWAKTAVDNMIYDKENHKKTPYEVLIDKQIGDKQIGSTEATVRRYSMMGVINHSNADGW